MVRPRPLAVISRHGVRLRRPARDPLRVPRGLGRVAGRSRRLGAGCVDQDCQERLRHPVGQLGPGGRGRPCPRLDRRTGQIHRRDLVPPTGHASSTPQPMVEDQPGDRRASDFRRHDASGGPACRRGGQGGWPLGRRLRPAVDGGRARRPAGRARRRARRGEVLRDARWSQPLRHPPSHPRGQEARDPARRIATFVAQLAAGETLYPRTRERP